MTKSKLVSVIIPVYNVEEYVEEAIRSIMNQTYNNLEIIVIDDCSSDNTFDIVKQLAFYDNRIKLYKNNYNLKIAGTLNRALSLSNGEYIVRMDGDDISLPSKIEQQLEYLENNLDIDLVGCHVIGIDQDGNHLHMTQTVVKWDITKKVINYVSPVFHIWMCRKSVYDKLSGYREMSGSEDYDFLLRMYTSNMKFTNIDEYLYKVRLRPGNTQTTAGLRQRKIAKYALKLMKERLKNKGIDSYNIDTFEHIVSSSRIMEWFHYLSVKCTYKAILCNSNKSYLCMFIFTFLSILLSPYQAKLFYERFKYKKELGINK